VLVDSRCNRVEGGPATPRVQVQLLSRKTTSSGIHPHPNHLCSCSLPSPSNSGGRVNNQGVARGRLKNLH
jgi:hypothetical protein